MNSRISTPSPLTGHFDGVLTTQDIPGAQPDFNFTDDQARSEFEERSGSGSNGKRKRKEENGAGGPSCQQM